VKEMAKANEEHEKDLENPEDYFDEFVRRFSEGMSKIKDLYHFGRLSGSYREIEKKFPLEKYRRPLVDIVEKENEIISKIELPGVDKKDIKINVSESGLEIKVEKKEEIREEDKEKGYSRIERSYKGFYRYCPLPESIDTEKVEAKYEKGILEVIMPKKEGAKKKTKTIEVK